MLAIEGDEPAFRCTEIRRPARLGIPLGLRRRPGDGWSRAGLAHASATTTIADLVAMVVADARPEGLVKAAVWLQQAMV